MAFSDDTSSGLDGGGSAEAVILHVQSSDFVVVANCMSLYPNTNVIAVDTPSRRNKKSSSSSSSPVILAIPED